MHLDKKWENSVCCQAIQKKLNARLIFEIDELDKAINGKFATMPKGLAQDPEAFEKWLREIFV